MITSFFLQAVRPKGKEEAVFLRKFLSQQLLTSVLFHVIFLFLLMTSADRRNFARTKDLAGETGVTPETNMFTVIFYHFLENLRKYFFLLKTVEHAFRFRCFYKLCC